MLLRKHIRVLLGVAIIFLIVLILWIVLAPVYRFETAWNSPMLVERESIVGIWIQYDDVVCPDGRTSTPTQGAVLCLDADQKFILSIANADGIQEYEGNYFYSSGKFRFLNVFPSGYRNWIKLRFDHEGPPQFYLKRERGAEPRMYRAAYNRAISSKPFVQK